MRQKGFTLIELLVVIAIISILATILLPSLSKARELAKSAACISNLKAAGTAMFMYGQESNGKVHLYTYPHSPYSELTWYALLAENDCLDNPNMSVCPSQDPFTYSPDILNGSGRYFMYGAEVTLNTPDEPLTVVDSVIGWSYFRDISQLTSPGYNVLLTDNVVGSTAWGDYYQNQYFVVRPDPLNTQAIGVHFRHSGLANSLLADGHVESCDEKRMKKSGFSSGYLKDYSIVTFD